MRCLQVKRAEMVEVTNSDMWVGDLEAGGKVAATDEPPATMGPALAASMVMGLIFGAVMDLGKVTNPIVIREQFIFQRFIMLKMFLSAAGTSAFCFAVLSKTAPRKFEAAREAFFPGLVQKGFLSVVIGPLLLGAGMALAGACPGMVLIQCGGGVTSGPVTLAGGFLGAIVFAFVQPYLVGVMGVCKIEKHKAEDFKILSKVPFFYLAMGVCAACFAIIAIFEVYFPWDSGAPGDVVRKEWRQWAWTAELPWLAEPWVNTLPPALMGLGVGFNQIPCVLFCADSIGSSTAYMTLSSQWLGLNKAAQVKMAHWEGYRVGVGNWWQAVYVLAAVLGAFISSWSTGTFNVAKPVKEWEAFLGGFIMIFGSRFGSGCTSGHGLSGMGLLAVKSIVAVPFMFAGGIVTGFIYQAVDPAGYTGFAYVHHHHAF